MPEYQFYPSTGSGIAPSFDACRLPSEAEAMLRAEVVLASHDSCSSVAVWTDDRLVMVIYRSVLGMSPARMDVRRQASETLLPA